MVESRHHILNYRKMWCKKCGLFFLANMFHTLTFAGQLSFSLPIKIAFFHTMVSASAKCGLTVRTYFAFLKPSFELSQTVAF